MWRYVMARTWRHLAVSFVVFTALAAWAYLTYQPWWVAVASLWAGCIVGVGLDAHQARHRRAYRALKAAEDARRQQAGPEAASGAGYGGPWVGSSGS